MTVQDVLNMRHAYVPYIQTILPLVLCWEQRQPFVSKYMQAIVRAIYGDIRALDCQGHQCCLAIGTATQCLFLGGMIDN